MSLALLLSSVICVVRCEEVYYPSNAVCSSYSIPLTISSAPFPFTYPKWTDQNGLTQFLIDDVARVPNLPSPLGKPHNETAQYTISATFCTPRKAAGNKPKTVILATHGLGFDRSYWNIAYKPSEYNFAEHAINQGYSVFFYDRLGVGESTRLSGYKAQLAQQLEIVIELASSLKAGKFCGSIAVPEKVALIGHSFGSVISHGVAAYAPEAIDAIILTGYNLNFTAVDFGLAFEGWNPRIASTLTKEFSGKNLDLDTGYISWVDLYANINTFYKAPNYEFAAAEYSENHKSPFGLVEVLTAELGPTLFPTPTFTGPVLLISGENDFIFCTGYCTDVLHDAAADVFHASKAFKSYIQPGTGYGMNFHKNATGYYGVVTDFLGENGP